MNNILFFGIFTFLAFAIFFVGLKLFHKDAIFTIAIGTLIGSNIYNVNAFPIIIGKLQFGMDSIIYTIFIFCMLLMYVDYGKKACNLLLYTSIFSLFFTAFLAFMGNYAMSGITADLVWDSLSYIYSIVATFFAVWLMILTFDFFIKKRVNWYITIFLALLVACIVNSLIYFGLTFLTVGSLGSSFLSALAGSYIGKLIATLFCLFIFWSETWWVKTYKTKKVFDEHFEDD